MFGTGLFNVALLYELRISFVCLNAETLQASVDLDESHVVMAL